MCSQVVDCVEFDVGPPNAGCHLPCCTASRDIDHMACSLIAVKTHAAQGQAASTAASTAVTTKASATASTAASTAVTTTVSTTISENTATEVELLEAAKAAAVATEDYDEAKRLKLAIEALRSAKATEEDADCDSEKEQQQQQQQQQQIEQAEVQPESANRWDCKSCGKNFEHVIENRRGCSLGTHQHYCQIKAEREGGPNVIIRTSSKTATVKPLGQTALKQAKKAAAGTRRRRMSEMAKQQAGVVTATAGLACTTETDLKIISKKRQRLAGRPAVLAAVAAAGSKEQWGCRKCGQTFDGIVAANRRPVMLLIHEGICKGPVESNQSDVDKQEKQNRLVGDQDRPCARKEGCTRPHKHRGHCKVNSEVRWQQKEQNKVAEDEDEDEEAESKAEAEAEAKVKAKMKGKVKKVVEAETKVDEDDMPVLRAGLRIAYRLGKLWQRATLHQQHAGVGRYLWNVTLDDGEEVDVQCAPSGHHSEWQLCRRVTVVLSPGERGGFGLRLSDDECEPIELIGFVGRDDNRRMKELGAQGVSVDRPGPGGVRTKGEMKGPIHGRKAQRTTQPRVVAIDEAVIKNRAGLNTALKIPRPKGASVAWTFELIEHDGRPSLSTKQPQQRKTPVPQTNSQQARVVKTAQQQASATCKRGRGEDAGADDGEQRQRQPSESETRGPQSDGGRAVKRAKQGREVPALPLPAGLIMHSSFYWYKIVVRSSASDSEVKTGSLRTKDRSEALRRLAFVRKRLDA